MIPSAITVLNTNSNYTVKQNAVVIVVNMVSRRKFLFNHYFWMFNCSDIIIHV